MREAKREESKRERERERERERARARARGEATEMNSWSESRNATEEHAGESERGIQMHDSS